MKAELTRGFMMGFPDLANLVKCPLHAGGCGGSDRGFASIFDGGAQCVIVIPLMSIRLAISLATKQKISCSLI